MTSWIQEEESHFCLQAQHFTAGSGKSPARHGTSVQTFLKIFYDCSFYVKKTILKVYLLFEVIMEFEFLSDLDVHPNVKYVLK